MKSNNQLLTLLCLCMTLVANFSFAQETNEQPAYVSVQTLHWDLDKDFDIGNDNDVGKWIDVEDEFWEKVIRKNEHILNGGVYLHYFTDDSSELVVVLTYPSWEAIDLAEKRNGELIAEAWPNEENRRAFMQERMSYYAMEHSDEIYEPRPGAKIMPRPTENMIVYVRRSELKQTPGSNWNDFMDLHMENSEKVIKKNPHIKGYYPLGHSWGAQRAEFVEAFYVESLPELENALQENARLQRQAWPNREAWDQRNEKLDNFFTGKHGDEIYHMIARLRK